MKRPRNLAGKSKQFPTDFVVEEIPLYEPCGDGEHLYITVQKTNMSHDECLHQISECFNVSKRDIGYAGRKDFRAVTTQIFSIYLRGKKLEIPTSIGNMEVLASSYHENKLRLGHLTGNKFKIRLRDVDVSEFSLIQKRLTTLCKLGLPNFFGPQRFGNNENNHSLGMAIVKEDWDCLITILLEGKERHHTLAREGEFKRALDAWPFGQPTERNVLESLVANKSPQQACKTISRQLQKLWVNALQSYLFNELLQTRLTDGSWNTLLLGDLAWMHNGGGRTFKVIEKEVHSKDLLQRIEAFSLSPSGPLWGSKMRLPAGAVLEKELIVRDSAGLNDEYLEKMRRIASGARRPLRVEVCEPKITLGNDEFGDFVQLQFALPAGSYATVVVNYCLASSSWFEKVAE